MQQENKPNLVNKVHISQSMVLHKVIGIRARINNKLSRHEKQGPGYTRPKQWEASVLTILPSLVLG